MPAAMIGYAKARRDEILRSTTDEEFEKKIEDPHYELKTSHTGFRHFKSQVRSSSIPAVDLELLPTR
jgi:hypothetical protein